MPVTHHARAHVDAASVEGVDVLRVPASAIKVHRHAASQVHGNGCAVISTLSDGSIHLVKELTERLRKLRKRFVHGQAWPEGGRENGLDRSLSFLPSR